MCSAVNYLHGTSQTLCVKYVRRSSPSVLRQLKQEMGQVKRHVRPTSRIFIELALEWATVRLSLKTCWKVSVFCTVIIFILWLLEAFRWFAIFVTIWIECQTASIKEQFPFRQRSSGGWRKHRTRPLVGVSALIYLQCFHTVGWVPSQGGQHLSTKLKTRETYQRKVAATEVYK